MNKSLKKPLICLALPFSILLVVILGCDAWANIKGKVIDENGKPLAGVKIVVKQGNSEVGEHETDASGKIDVNDNLCPMIGCSTGISISLSKDGYQRVDRHFDANKDKDMLKKGDLIVTLIKE